MLEKRWITRVGLGEDSHRLNRLNNITTDLAAASTGAIYLGGVLIPCAYTLAANSDGDVVLHALCRALGSLSNEQLLGERADKLVQAGLKSSKQLLDLALKDFYANQSFKNNYITQISISIEAKEPRLANYLEKMQNFLVEQINQFQAPIHKLQACQIGISAMSGEGLSACGLGQGIAVKALVTAQSQLRDELID